MRTGVQDYIPRPDAAFLEWLKPCVNGIAVNSSDWSIPQEKINALNSQCTAFETAFERAENPATRTAAAIAAKNTARADAETELRAVIKQYITYNSDISDEERINIGLPVHKTTHTPVPVPATYPDLVIEPDGIRRVRLSFKDHDKHSTAKPHGTLGAVLRWAILPAPPVDVEDLTDTVLDTRSPYVFTFAEHQRGKALYVCAAWQNTKGEKGAWSEIVNIFIP